MSIQIIKNIAIILKNLLELLIAYELSKSDFPLTLLNYPSVCYTI